MNADKMIIRTVLEGLKQPHGCWCSSGNLALNTHTLECRNAQGLYRDASKVERRTGYTIEKLERDPNDPERLKATVIGPDYYYYEVSVTPVITNTGVLDIVATQRLFAWKWRRARLLETAINNHSRFDWATCLAAEFTDSNGATD